MERALGIALPVASQQIKGSGSFLAAAPPWGPPVTMDRREGGGSGAHVHPVLGAVGEDGGLARGSHRGSPGAWLVVPLGLPLPAHAWSLPTTISPTERPFKTHHKSPGSKVVTLGTASPRSWKESVSQLGWLSPRAGRRGQWPGGSQCTSRTAVLCLRVHS